MPHKHVGVAGGQAADQADIQSPSPIALGVVGAVALGAPYDFLYANMKGAAATLMLADLVAAHGHVLRIDPEHAAVRA